MTTICFDGKIFAADSQSLNSSYTASRVTKLWKFPEDRYWKYFGCSGDFQNGLVAKKYFERDELGTKPTLPENFSGLLLDKENRVFRVENLLEPWQVEYPVAIGSGRDFALAAMLLGFSATAAIRFVIEHKLDVGTGGEIVSYLVEGA